MASQTLRRNTRRKSTLHILEPLEVRALFSAVIGITGNGIEINAADITPSIPDFTDFGYMSTTPNLAFGKLTHSFGLFNIGDGTLTLTGGLKPIKITGPAAGDFSIFTLPGNNIAAGTTNGTTFVIAFAPHGTGVRSALITIPSNDPTTPNFTFTVQGTGVKTTSIKVNNDNFTTTMQVATIVIGTGTDHAIPGSDVTINYTHHLATGTDVSVASGHTHSEFILGVPLGEPEHISGWDQGLLGIKANETRVLFVPSVLAFGTASGYLPANSPLIYTVTDTALVQPAVVVSGNNVNIAFNDTTPSLTDNTIIGTTVAGDLTPITVTFKVTNGSGGTILYPEQNVVVTGKDAANFTSTNLTAGDLTGTFAIFTVTFHPSAGAGTQNAVVNLITNDPLHPDFKFNISGITTPFQDLSATLATANYAGPIITGATTLFKLPVKVTNNGNFAAPNQFLTYNVYLHNATGGTDTLIASPSSNALKGLAVGKSATVNLNVPIPITVLTGSYEFRVVVNENASLTETSYTNNIALSSQVLNMTHGFYDLTATIGTTSFPAATPILSGSTTLYKVPVTVTNTGNLPIPANADPVALKIFVHNATGGTDTLGTSLTTTALRKLATGNTFKTTINTPVPIAVTSGTFQFKFDLNSTDTLTESTLSNNVILSAQTFSVTQGVFNIAGNLSSSTFATTIAHGLPVTGKLTFVVTNAGNLTLPSNQHLNVQVVAISDDDDSQTAIGTLTNISVGLFTAGKSATFSLTKTLVAGLTAGSYHLAIVLSPTPALTQNTADDLLDETAAHDDFTLLVTP